VFRHSPILLIIALCVACSTATVPPTATARPIPTATIEPTVPATASPLPTESPTPGKKKYDYKDIYRDGSFTIREAFLGADAFWSSDFKMPQARIENIIQTLGLGREMICNKQPTSNLPCTQTLEIPLENGGADQYILGLESLNGGKGSLIKNGRLIWSGYTNGGKSFAILSSIRIGDEIALDYSKSNWGSNDKPLWVTGSILLTKGNNVVLIPDTFGLNVIQGKLIYFRVRNRKAILVFDGKERGETYNEVLNRLCCWHGPPIEIASNGEFIDFFAQKGRDWYHVQAGYLQDVK